MMIPFHRCLHTNDWTIHDYSGALFKTCHFSISSPTSTFITSQRHFSIGFSEFIVSRFSSRQRQSINLSLVKWCLGLGRLGLLGCGGLEGGSGGGGGAVSEIKALGIHPGPPPSPLPQPSSLLGHHHSSDPTALSIHISHSARSDGASSRSSESSRCCLLLTRRLHIIIASGNDQCLFCLLMAYIITFLDCTLFHL